MSSFLVISSTYFILTTFSLFFVYLKIKYKIITINGIPIPFEIKFILLLYMVINKYLIVCIPQPKETPRIRAKLTLLLLEETAFAKDKVVENAVKCEEMIV